MDDDELLRKIEDSYWRMSRAPEQRRWRPPATELNPGSFKPQDQVVHALPVVDQTRKVTTRPGGVVDSNGNAETRNVKFIDQAKNVTTLPGGVVDSNGNAQTSNLSFDDGVHATGGAPMIPRQFNGEAQLMNLKPLDQGISASVGTSPAVDVNVSGQNLHLAPHLPLPSLPAVTHVNADVRKHGSGVPKTVNIR